MEELDNLLKRLTEVNGVGYSGRVASVILDELKRLNMKCELNQDGSVCGFIPGRCDLNVMIACHLDEIGFIVHYIENNGFIRFREIGECDVRILPGQEVVIMGRKEIKGYVGIKPPHLRTKDEKEKVLRIDELFIDTGLKTKDLKKMVSIGDTIAFAEKYTKLRNDFRSCKGLDNRASIACGISILAEFSRVGAPCNLHFIATSQEETTGLGARIHSYKLPLDYAIVIDVIHGEHPEIKEGKVFPLNKGPVIGRGATIPQKLFKMLVDVAKEHEIPYQIEPLPSWTGTDADFIAFNKEGIPTCLLEIPLRYMHTPVEVVSLKDIERTGRLAISFIKKLAAV